MNYKIKAGEVKRKVEELGRYGKMRLPIRLSYVIAYNAEKIEREYERLEKERIKLCEQHAEKDENGKAIMEIITEGERNISKYKFTPEEEKAFSDEYNDFLNEEIEITDLRTVKLSEIEKCEGNDRYGILSVKEIANITFMLEE